MKFTLCHSWLPFGSDCLMLCLICLLFVMGALPLRAMSDVEEIKLGESVAHQVERPWGKALPASDPLSRRVRRIGQAFASLSKRRVIPFSYKVLDNEKILNALATPGGNVYITRRLLRLMANDAELAAVLGHETAHIDLRHGTQTLEKRQRAQALAFELGDKVLGKGKAHRAVSLAADVAFIDWSRGYSREQENEADKQGARWMSRLGYDPRAAVSMLGHLGDLHESEVEQYLASHPAPQHRRATVRHLIAREHLLRIAKTQGGPRLWDDGLIPQREGDLARRANSPTPSAPATLMARSKPAPAVIQTEAPTTSKKQHVTMPPPSAVTRAQTHGKLAQTAEQSTQAPPRQPTHIEPVRIGEVNLPRDVVLISDVPQPLPQSSPPWPLLFVILSALFFVVALYGWFATQPDRLSHARFVTRRHTIEGVEDRTVISSLSISGPVLIFVSRQGLRFEQSILPGHKILLGRALWCDICLDDEQVSQSHAEISFDGLNFYIADCTSTNGTWLNGHRITSASLREGDAVHIGRTTLRTSLSQKVCHCKT
ncbi:MAG TPA: M48 family metalloprotease [Abditibacteriaceae bacterium]